MTFVFNPKNSYFFQGFDVLNLKFFSTVAQCKTLFWYLLEVRWKLTHRKMWQKQFQICSNMYCDLWQRSCERQQVLPRKTETNGRCCWESFIFSKWEFNSKTKKVATDVQLLICLRCRLSRVTFIQKKRASGLVPSGASFRFWWIFFFFCLLIMYAKPVEFYTTKMYLLIYKIT